MRPHGRLCRTSFSFSLKLRLKLKSTDHIIHQRQRGVPRPQVDGCTLHYARLQLTLTVLQATDNAFVQVLLVTLRRQRQQRHLLFLSQLHRAAGLEGGSVYIVAVVTPSLRRYIVVQKLALQPRPRQHAVLKVAIAQAVRADEIDILVELGGHTAGNALPVFAYRAAKVQICGIGYFNSTGISECDGFLSDVYCSPAEHSPYFTERLLQLPHTHFCYQPYKKFPEPVPPPCRQNNYITFGSFNNFAKVNDGMLCLWRELLQQVPNSRLLLKHQLLGTEEGREYTLSRLRKLQLPIERIELRSYSADYLREYGDMDIALDTSPYPGGLTTCEALYMGVPVVTLTGNRHGARFGKSFLCNLGLGELVAESPEQYVNIARTLAGDGELLTALRQTLRRMMLASPLMDSRMYMQDVENLYRQIMLKRE